MVAHPAMDTEALEPATTVAVDSITGSGSGPGAKDAKSGGGVSNKKTVTDIITSIDPNVKVDPEVEDVRSLTFIKGQER